MIEDELGSLAALVVVAQERSFTRAAGKLGTSQSALSHRIRRLEARLGVKLLVRNTRSVSPTEVGAQLLKSLGPSIEQIRQQLCTLTPDAGEPSGLIRISSPDHVAETILWPVLDRLLDAHPRLMVELNVDNRLVDIVAEGYTAGVRLGDQVDRDMVSVPIGLPERLVVVGSPLYLAAHGIPEHPTSLREHRCISRTLPTLGGTAVWVFQKDQERRKVRVSGRLTLNRPEMIRNAAVSGHGLAQMLASQCLAELKAGLLVEVLQAYSTEVPGYRLYYPRSTPMTSGFRSIVNSLKIPE